MKLHYSTIWLILLFKFMMWHILTFARTRVGKNLSFYIRVSVSSCYLSSLPFPSQLLLTTHHAHTHTLNSLHVLLFSSTRNKVEIRQTSNPCLPFKPLGCSQWFFLFLFLYNFGNYNTVTYVNIISTNTVYLLLWLW